MKFPSHFILIIAVFFLIAGSVQSVRSQSDPSSDNRSGVVPRKPEEDDKPKGFRENMEKMRIDQEKKEYERMVGRSDEAARLASELQLSFSKNPTMGPEDVARLASLEKLASKIRRDLGGKGADPSDDDAASATARIGSRSEALSQLKERTTTLLSELKKATRFSISVTAIEASNSIIKLVRFLRSK